ncbi:inorganic triphosphatase [Phyllobacterium brassicacearum]|uniref:Inorganic triphosphatase n=1 Tax=Phyllobacterium brassicacearum TaxID=314235 RepID=A0A2P7AJP4_9HYPH|nr:CYTH and CHAD domain-containing protein [Phyllobacterium brassicacearum]PSH54443.1 inorganic triphosphatase [Phyllobacterium brassicacearum]TDQ30540.1 inorganic triphosphatase YgiF [Phyllobacterium brassicacearum]
MATSVRNTVKQSSDDDAAQRSAAPVETELKLLAPPGALDAVRSSPAVLQSARNKGTIRRLEATYYDTADHQLFGAGLSLRVRRSGKRFTQTIKRLSVKNPLARDEWESPVEAPAPDLDALPTGEIDGIFSTIAANDLVPVFVTRVRRHAIALDVPDGQIEIAFDDGVIEAGEQREPLSEIELELKQGRAATLYKFGLGLMDVSPLCLETQSKSSRGYALALNINPAAVKAGSSSLRREDTVDEGIAKLLSGCQQQILANLCAAEDGREPEGIHQLRVALRRLRTALYFLRRELESPSLQALDAEAQRFARTLGPARNWDVFVDLTLTDIEKADLPDIEFSTLREASAPFREKGYQAVRHSLSDPRTNRFLLSLGLAIEQRNWRNDVASEDLAILAEPLTRFASRVLSSLERKALKRGRHFRHLRPEARHKLRITLKKLRYTAEFFLPLYSDQASTKKYLKQLSRLQDVLGEANDIITSRDLLADLRESNRNPDVHRAIGAVIGWQGHVALAGADRMHGRWRKFSRTTPFWMR